ncbi:P-loop containing nucleoside triphosphate hydrolase protein, partial [Tribonema minus]
EFKICVLGDKGVGKTCLVLRFIEGYFSQNQQSTIGAFFLTKSLPVNGVLCKLQIWDTAGQERFRAMAPMYYRNAAAAIVCCDITDEESFDKMKDWVEEIKMNVPVGQQGLAIVLALNKTDLEERRVVSRARAEEFAASIGAAVVETSARENWGVARLFECACERV